MRQISRLEVIETGARRRWTPEEKQRIVAESFGAPRIVSATARRHGLSNSQLFTWRPEHRMPDAPPEPGPESLLPQTDRKVRAAGRMEIVLSGARRVIVGSDVDAAALMRVIDALERR